MRPNSYLTFSRLNLKEANHIFWSLTDVLISPLLGFTSNILVCSTVGPSCTEGSTNAVGACVHNPWPNHKQINKSDIATRRPHFGILNHTGLVILLVITLPRSQPGCWESLVGWWAFSPVSVGSVLYNRTEIWRFGSRLGKTGTSWRRWSWWLRPTWGRMDRYWTTKKVDSGFSMILSFIIF